MLIETRNMKIPGPWLKLNAAASIASFGIVVAAPHSSEVLQSYGGGAPDDLFVVDVKVEVSS